MKMFQQSRGFTAHKQSCQGGRENMNYFIWVIIFVVEECLFILIICHFKTFKIMWIPSNVSLSIFYGDLPGSHTHTHTHTHTIFYPPWLPSRAKSNIILVVCSLFLLFQTHYTLTWKLFKPRRRRLCILNIVSCICPLGEQEMGSLTDEWPICSWFTMTFIWHDLELPPKTTRDV